jgi:hypothetical protein
MPSIFNLIGATILTWTAAYFFNVNWRILDIVRRAIYCGNHNGY